MKTRVLFTLGMISCVGMTGLAATTRYVVPPVTPGANPVDGYTSWEIAATNIQDAITASAYGDTVLVSNGVYHLTAEIVLEQNIVLQSYSDGVIDPLGTILDAQYPAYSNRCLYVNNASALVEGFTFTNGFPQVDSRGGNGGGLYLQGGAKAKNCHFLGNKASGAGGGVFIENYSTLADSSVIGNRAGDSAEGGGVRISYTGTITNCFVLSNRSLFGGGVSSVSGSHSYIVGLPHILGCIISNNVAQPPEGAGGSGGQGAGIKSTNYSMIDGCLITHNTAGASTSGEIYGAGIKMGTGGLLRNSTISYNKNIGLCYGGGIDLGYASVSNCAFIGNSASYGGGVYLSGTSQLVDCTIISNSAAAFVQGGSMRNCFVAYNNAGIWSLSGSANYQNCTIVNNGGTGISFSDASTIENSIVYNNNSGGDNWNGSACTWINSCTAPMPAGENDVGNVADAPRFVDAVAGDFNLIGSSPCIDKGIYRDWMAGANDLQGRKRIIGQGVDMGAFEAPLPLGTLFTIR